MQKWNTQNQSYDKKKAKVCDKIWVLYESIEQLAEKYVPYSELITLLLGNKNFSWKLIDQ